MAQEEASALAPRSTVRFWLEAGSAILDPDRRILFIDDSLARWLEEESPGLAGKNFDCLLRSRIPAWGKDLDEVWTDSSNLGRRRLKHDCTNGAQWYSLEVARNIAGWFIRLSSALPPHEELAGDAWDQHLGGVAERRQMYVRLLRAEAQLDNLVRRWPGVIFSQRADFSFQFVSPRIEELTGIPVELWRRQPKRFWEVIHEADVEEVKQQCKLAAESAQGVTNAYRIRHVRTGQLSYVLEHRQAVLSRTGLLLAYEGAWLDITRQTIAEKRLCTAAWKETLATLTMGLAHDFGNIISGIFSLSEYFLAQLEPQHPFVEGMNMIRQNCLQASQLVQRIINLHRSKTGERNYHDLNLALTETIDLAQKILPRRIQIETHLTKEKLPVYMDVVEFRQVILNLALNAADAMPERGKLVLRTTLCTRLEPMAHVQGVSPRLPCACLAVEDNGRGIASRHLPLVFDPFFTTKPIHKGSGLGLYNAKLFIEKHHGAISVDSAEGVGTTFRLWLPQADFTEVDVVQAVPAGRRRSLLLVSEAGPLCDSTVEMLRAHGHYVAVTTTPERAMELLVSEENQFMGVMVMAGSSDRPLIEFLVGLRRLKLPVKIIFLMVRGNQDEIESQWLESVHLMMSGDTPEETILNKLDSLFNDERTP